MNLRQLGSMGEQIAGDYLKAEGFKLVEKNFRCRLGEMDIIAKKGGEVFFIEVKTRKNDGFGTPFESITLKKQKQIIKIAKYFLLREKREINCHFSVIGVLLNESGPPDVRFLCDAFGES